MVGHHSIRTEKITNAVEVFERIREQLSMSFLIELASTVGLVQISFNNPHYLASILVWVFVVGGQLFLKNR